MSFLKVRLCFPCLQSSPIAMRNPRPRNTLMPAAIATSSFDDGVRWVEDEFDAHSVAVVVTVLVAEMVSKLLEDDSVTVAVTVVMAETVSVLFGDVEPDVRL